MLSLGVQAQAQDRTGGGDWDIPAGWWPFAVVAAGVLLFIAVGWALLQLAPLILAIVAAVLGIRWLTKSTRDSRSDPAVAVLGERYARGEITKEEYDAKLRDLGALR